MVDVRHVAVVGLMGSGKTTFGALLAARLGWPFRDSDADIEASRGRTVRELRDEVGTRAMHRFEAEQLLAVLAEPGPSVVAGAASVVDDERCIVALRDPRVAVVWLTVGPEAAAARFRSSAHRPWYGDDPVAFLARQAAERNPRFRSLGGLELATDARSPTELVDAALAWLADRGIVAPDTIGPRDDHRRA